MRLFGMLCLAVVASVFPVGCGGGIETGAPKTIEFDRKTEPDPNPSSDMSGKSAAPKPPI